MALEKENKAEQIKHGEKVFDALGKAQRCLRETAELINNDRWLTMNPAYIMGCIHKQKKHETFVAALKGVLIEYYNGDDVDVRWLLGKIENLIVNGVDDDG
ncbi:MAG: hypothetical protein V3V61_01130 [Gammaproteobacteria bacterium]